ncbi:MAG: hypothetical protein MUF54_07930 [Polyangiaceae bacterium]|jgi:hypothetical protein|nr:hypothetical protein [Polyangiaceae bacterium]
MTEWWQDLKSAERRIHSQCGEEGVIAAIFTRIGTTNRVCVDIGAGDPVEYSNTRALLDVGWTGHLFDCKPSGHAHQAKFNAENACDILASYGVPSEFDLLCIDIDGIDWYVLRAILAGGYKPRVIVAEINCNLPADPPMTVAYDPDFTFDGSLYHGGSLGAYRVLGGAFGYLLVHQTGLLNCFLIRKDCLPEGAQAGELGFFQFTAHEGDKLNRQWVPV